MPALPLPQHRRSIIMTNLMLKTSLIPLTIAGLFIATNIHAAGILI